MTILRMILRYALRYWRELALVATGVALYSLGSCARARGIALAAWKDSAQVAHQHSADAVAKYSASDHATTAVAVDLDSARAAWRRTLAASTAAAQHGAPSLPGPALGPVLAPALPSPLVAAGESLDRSCHAYQTTCEQLQAAARAAIDSLERENALLRRRPPDPVARRFQPFVAGGYDVLARAPALRAGGDVRVAGDWRLVVDVERRIVPGDTTRLAVWIRKSF